MNNVYWKNTIASVFLLTFLLVRIVNVHTITHIDDESDSDHCELCEIISINNQSELLFDSNTYEFNNPLNSIVTSKKIALNYSNPLQTVSTPSFVYNKPPPING